MNRKSYIRIAFVFALALFVSVCEEDNLGLENVGLDNFGLDQAGGFVAITSSATSAVEGGTVDVTISVPNPVGSDVAVTFGLGGAATFGTDYTVTSDDGVTAAAGSGSGTIVFDIDGGGADDVTFTINFANDATVETGESVIVTLTGATATNGTQVDLGDPTTNPGGDPTIAATIAVSDPEVTVGLGSVSSVTEKVVKDTVSVPVVFSGGAVPGGSADVTYTITSKNGIATAGVDYNDISDALTGLTADGEISIEILPDQVVDGDTLIIEITAVSSTTGVTVDLDDAADSVGIAIVDDFSVVSHSSGDLTLTSSDAAPVATTREFVIGLSSEVDSDVTISYSLSDAVAGISIVDGGSLVIEAGDLSGKAVISVDPSVFAGMTDLTTSLVIDGVTSASAEVSLSMTAADLTRSITIDNTP